MKIDNKYLGPFSKGRILSLPAKPPTIDKAAILHLLCLPSRAILG